MSPEEKIRELGLVLPEPMKIPPDVTVPFSWVRIRGDRAYVSGHIALNADGTLHDRTGKVGGDVSIEEAYESARLAGLAMLSDLRRELGSLDRITAWLRVFGMVNVAPGFVRIPPVINGFSDLIIEVFGAERGDHCRSAVGLAELPFGTPVEVEAEVEISQ